MKKFLVLAVCLITCAAMADSSELFIKLFKAQSGKVETGAGNKLFTMSLSLTADQNQPAKAYYKKYFLINSTDTFKFEGEVKGTGTALVEIQLLDIAGKEITTISLAKKKVDGRYRDFEAEVNLGRIRLKRIPTTAKLIIGADKNSSVSFTDMEVEIDND